MRTARIKAEGAGYYHCMSRVIERRHVLESREKGFFRKLMRKVEEFSGVRILTYAIMGNHFHILVHVPERQEISDRELLRRMRLLYGEGFVEDYARTLREAKESGQEEYYGQLRERYLYRMYEVSQFMKTLKQRFSMWFNRGRERKGTLWEERFKSILIEDRENALMTMALYIDLNAVRGGVVSDPKDYRYCGYGEAVGGSKRAREGLAGVMLTLGGSERVWGQVSHKYRRMLYVRGERTEKRAGLSSEAVAKVLEEGGKLTLAEGLRCRVRYFSDGVVLGSREFVEGVFGKHREEFGLKRRTGARGMKWCEWGGLCTMRDLRNEVVIGSSA
jgi:putative transposase